MCDNMNARELKMFFQNRFTVPEGTKLTKENMCKIIDSCKKPYPLPPMSNRIIGDKIVYFYSRSPINSTETLDLISNNSSMEKLMRLSEKLKVVIPKNIKSRKQLRGILLGHLSSMGIPEPIVIHIRKSKENRKVNTPIMTNFNTENMNIPNRGILTTNNTNVPNRGILTTNNTNVPNRGVLTTNNTNVPNRGILTTNNKNVNMKFKGTVPKQPNLKFNNTKKPIMVNMGVQKNNAPRKLNTGTQSNIIAKKVPAKPQLTSSGTQSNNMSDIIKKVEEINNKLMQEQGV